MFVTGSLKDSWLNWLIDLSLYQHDDGYEDGRSKPTDAGLQRPICPWRSPIQVLTEVDIF